MNSNNKSEQTRTNRRASATTTTAITPRARRHLRSSNVIAPAASIAMELWEKTWSSHSRGYKLVGLTWNQLDQTVSEAWIETDDNESPGKGEEGRSKARKREGKRPGNGEGGRRIKARNEVQMLAQAPTTAALQDRWYRLREQEQGEEAQDQWQESGQAAAEEDPEIELESGEPQGEEESGKRKHEKYKVKDKVKGKGRGRRSRANKRAEAIEAAKQTVVE